jgi:formylglycine-generating enzyme required for sulfatase activity
MGIAKLGERKRLISAFAQLGGSKSPGMVLVEGGTLPEGSEFVGQEVLPFLIAPYLVTGDEWQPVRTYGLSNGYGCEVGESSGPRHPITMVNWYDVVKWCNAKSEMEGLQPVYTVAGEVYKSGEFGSEGSNVVDMNTSANGYRLPSEAEWEWAARGGVHSQGYTYSGSNNLNAVGWFGDNAGDSTHEVGTKAANEIGLYDMSGNVWEWGWDFCPVGSSYRSVRGGYWFYSAAFCAVSYRGSNSPVYRSHDIGVRPVRSFGK